MNQLPTRKKNRLENINYTENGVYFITICSKDKKCIFSKVYPAANDALAPEIKLSSIGRILNDAVNDIENHYENVSLVNYVIMPNHIHLLISIEDVGGRIISAPIDDLQIKWDYIEGNPAQWLLKKDEYCGK